MNTLLIIESPGKKAKLESILGAGYTVRASFGHIRDLPDNSMGVAAPEYRPEYVVSDDRAKAAIAALKVAVAKADRVLLATDADREGEAIAWHVADALGLKDPQRVTYGEITAKAVLAAVAAPRPLNMDLVFAQEARRVLDRLVGYEVSPALSVRAGKKLSAGRVQSPAVRLVVDRDRAIEAFKPTTHYGAELRFPAPAPWKALWAPALAAGQEYMLDNPLAVAAAAIRRVRVVEFANTESKAGPPAPFTTSTLQQRAQVALKLKPKRTMEIAQKLYEQGVITYMRTDSPNLSATAWAEIADYAASVGLEIAVPRRTFKAKGNAQEAHEAIRPTHPMQLEAGETPEEKALYRLIWQRAIASQLADATFAVRTATLQSLDLVGADPAQYVARGRTLISKGWKAVYDEQPEDDELDEAKAEASNPVPALVVGDVLDVGDGVVLTKVTKAPKRFTQATLIKELESLGIGRPSTYASILDNITKREYITEDQKNFLSSTALGCCVVDHLVGTFTFIGLDYTSALEQSLDAIAEGARKYREVISGAHQHLTAELKALGGAKIHSCSECGAPMRRLTSKGSAGAFWGCSTYPTCKATRPDADGQPGTRKALGAEAESAGAMPCPDCGKPLRRNTRAPIADPRGKGWDFLGCSGYPSCKYTAKPPEGSKTIPNAEAPAKAGAKKALGGGKKKTGAAAALKAARERLA